MLINHRLAKLKYLHIDFVASICFMQTIKISVTLGVIIFSWILVSKCPFLSLLILSALPNIPTIEIIAIPRKF